MGQRPSRRAASRLPIQHSARQTAAPDPEAAERRLLALLCRADGVQINHAEIALDAITPFASELKRTVGVGIVQRRHGTKQGTIFPNDNFRTGNPYRPGIVLQAYDTKPSKVYGEFPCFHLEAKINGVRALRQLGINSVSDLLTFDHARFWQRHFVVAEINMARLGRYHTNRRDGTRRRAPLIHRTKSEFVYNVDAAVGNVLWRVFAAVPDAPAYTVQQFVKAYAKASGTHPYIMACTIADLVGATLLHRFGGISGPDLSLLEPEAVIRFVVKGVRRARTHPRCHRVYTP